MDNNGSYFDDESDYEEAEQVSEVSSEDSEVQPADDTSENKSKNTDDTDKPVENDDMYTDDEMYDDGNLPEDNDASEDDNREKAAGKHTKTKPEPIEEHFDDEDDYGNISSGGAAKVFKGIGIGAAILLVIAIIAAAVVVMNVPEDRVAENVYVENLYVGGLTYDEALASIEQTYLLEEKNITVTCNGVAYSIVGKEIGIGADAESTAEKAFNYGKTGSKIKDAWNALVLKFKKHVIVPTAVINDELLDEKLNEFGVLAYGELVQHSIEVSDTEAVLVPGSTGYDGDPTEARGLIKWHITYESFDNIDLSETLKSADPDPITIEQLDGAVYLDPTDAYFSVKDNEVTVVAEESGRFIDKTEAQEILDAFNAAPERTVVPVYQSSADVKASDIQSKLFNATLASYSTSYASSAAGRKTNVALAASKLDGKVIGVGETFSFNTTVGHRTTANGFMQAPEYSNGTSIIGVGGGTCQVSTTLFNAVLLADLEITERWNHSLTVHYVPLGRDATVTDGGADFKFVNNTGYPVKLTSTANGSTLTISVVGTAYSPSRDVQLSVTQSGGSYILTRKTYADGTLVRAAESWKSTYKNG